MSVGRSSQVCPEVPHESLLHTGTADSMAPTEMCSPQDYLDDTILQYIMRYCIMLFCIRDAIESLLLELTSKLWGVGGLRKAKSQGYSASVSGDATCQIGHKLQTRNTFAMTATRIPIWCHFPMYRDSG